MSLYRHEDYIRRGGYPHFKKAGDRWRKKNKDKVRGYIYRWRSKNKDKIVSYSVKSQKKCTANWKKYFIEKYGETPNCEICGIKLQWYRKNGNKNTVYIDHESEAIFIKKTPASWYRSHPCIEENIKKFEKLHLGILCCKCNHYLPTKNRLQWLKQVTNYILKER
jgi:hypothetical protein